jgi:hypothetical protein
MALKRRFSHRHLHSLLESRQPVRPRTFRPGRRRWLPGLLPIERLGLPSFDWVLPQIYVQ